MPRQLNVYGTVADGRHRCIVAATSMKAAAEAMGVAYSYLRGYCAITHNTTEIETATAEPGIPFVRHLNGSGPFVRLERGQHKPPRPL